MKDSFLTQLVSEPAGGGALLGLLLGVEKDCWEMWWENMTTEGKEKTEIPNAFFTSVFNSETSYSWDTHPPDLEVWEKETPP